MGSIASLAGCSNQAQQGMSKDEFWSDEFVPTKPEENPLVENGVMTYTPLIHAPLVMEVNPDQASVEMRIMPNPVDDYELEVYYTPVDEHGDGWDKRGYGYNRFISYDEEEDRFAAIREDAFPQYRVNSHGEKITSKTIPSKAAGTSSGKVSLPEHSEIYEKLDQYGSYATIFKIPNRPNTNPLIGDLKEEMDLPAIGDWYREKEFDHGDAIGSYLLGPNNAYRITANEYPYIVDFDFDFDIPKYEPFVLTFGINDPNSEVSRDRVLATTVQIMRVGEEKFVFPDTSGSGLYEPQNWESRDQVDRNYNKSTVEIDGDDLYNTKIKEETDDERTWKITRSTNLGRYSEKLDPSSDYHVFDNATLPYGTEYPHYMDSSYQNLWSVEYTVSQSQIDELDESVGVGKDDIRSWTHNSQVQNHPVIQDVAKQLKEIADRIDATDTVEQVRLVADFVQYFTHRLEGTGVGYSNKLPEGYNVVDNTNPLATLYECEGDCVSFTILANTILRTDYFNVEPDVAHIEETNVFTASSRTEVGHVSMGIPYDQMKIHSADDTEYHYIGSREAEAHDIENMTYSQADYVGEEGGTLYVELSDPSHLGATKSSISGDIASY